MSTPNAFDRVEEILAAKDADARRRAAEIVKRATPGLAAELGRFKAGGTAFVKVAPAGRAAVDGVKRLGLNRLKQSGDVITIRAAVGELSRLLNNFPGMAAKAAGWYHDLSAETVENSTPGELSQRFRTLVEPCCSAPGRIAHLTAQLEDLALKLVEGKGATGRYEAISDPRIDDGETLSPRELEGDDLAGLKVISNMKH